MAKITQGGKKNRKHGRNGRRPGKVRYTLQRRWITNKSRRVLRCNGERAWAAWCDRLSPDDASHAARVAASTWSHRLGTAEAQRAA